jgi:LuxR family maltose regulon positive regulatory protein
VIEIHLLRALAFQAQGDMAQAMTALEHALLLAEPAGYMRIFHDEGGPMGELLRQAATRGMGGGLRESIARGFWCAGGHIGVWQDGGSTSASLC